MKCSECRREIGYHAPHKDGKPALVRCWRTGVVGTALSPNHEEKQ